MADPDHKLAFAQEAKAKAANQKLRDSRAQEDRLQKHAEAVKEGRTVPALNPADRAVERMREHAAHMAAFKDLPPPNSEAELKGRILRLENTLQLVLDSLNGATIECNAEDSTITLTFPDLPT